MTGTTARQDISQLYWDTFLSPVEKVTHKMTNTKRAFQRLREGDHVLFNDRKRSLEVIRGYQRDGVIESVIVKSNRGTRYQLHSRRGESRVSVVNIDNPDAEQRRVRNLRTVQPDR